MRLQLEYEWGRKVKTTARTLKGGLMFDYEDYVIVTEVIALAWLISKRNWVYNYTVQILKEKC